MFSLPLSISQLIKLEACHNAKQSKGAMTTKTVQCSAEDAQHKKVLMAMTLGLTTTDIIIILTRPQ